MNLTAVLPVALALLMGEVGGVVRRLREIVGGGLSSQAKRLTRIAASGAR